jgi:hypothetical protein
LLAEVIERAVATQHLDEAERAAKRARAAIDERLSSTPSLDPRPFDALSVALCSFVTACKDDSWLAWLLRAYARAGVVPSAEIVERIRSHVAQGSSFLLTEAEAIISASRSRSAAMGQSEQTGLVALERWCSEGKQRSS